MKKRTDLTSIKRRLNWTNFCDAGLHAVIMNWHGGQNDPVYAVGSSLYADRAEYITKEIVQDAIHNLNLTLRDLKNKHYRGVSRADVAELKYAVEFLIEIESKMV